jgi:hypothetical protein
VSDQPARYPQGPGRGEVPSYALQNPSDFSRYDAGSFEFSANANAEL